MDELRFDGRSAIVTGAGRGVGRCHALLLAERGAKVVVADLGGAVGGGGSSEGPAQEVVEEIEAAGGEAVACHASVAEEDGAASIVRTAIEAFGRIDIVVNNAGIAAPEWLEDLTFADFQRMTAVHYLGTVLVAKAAWPHMIEAGYGRIVNTWSEAVLGFVPKSTPYAGGKGGVVGFTKALALEGPRHGIKVNGVAPRAQTRLSGPEIMAKTYDVPVEMFQGEGTSLDVFAPELVSPAMAYLAHESCALNGELLVSGGGQVLRVALVANDGYRNEKMTPELVAEHLDQIMDISEGVAIEVGTMAGDEISAAREEAGVD
jgi:NAD(P)-dependent dehydrogenase (short-subunit alcohol dehydrogenase family)